MGAFQLPDSVYGAAIGCLIYSSLCLIANVILVWLIWVHRERTSYVAFISYLTLLATVSSVVQQLYDYILWEDIRTWQFWYARGNSHDAEVQYQNEIFGLKLALSYVRIFCFMIEASLVFFFSLALAATVHGWWAKSVTALRKLSIIGRVLPVTLAVISIVLLQLEFAHNSFITYMVIANAQFVLSLVGASVFLVMILYKYLQTRRRLNTWLTLDYGQNGKPATATTGSTGKRATTKSLRSRRSRAYSGSQPSATFDNWLIIRLFIAFIMLCVFEYTNISPRFSNRKRVLENLNDTGPDLTHSRAMKTVTGYLSGVSPSLLAFLVFGTTKAFQRKMARTFIPAFLRRKNRDDDNITSIYHLPMSSTVNSSYARASTALFPNQPQTPTTAKGHHYRTSTSAVRVPDAVAFSPGTAKERKGSLQLKQYKSVSSLSSSKYESSTTTTATSSPTEQNLPPPPPPAAIPGNRVLSPIREPQWEDWLNEGSTPEPDTPEPDTPRRSQIGIALSEPSFSEPSSPTGPNVVAPWHEPMPLTIGLSPSKSSASPSRRPSFSAPRRGLTFFRDSPDYSSSDNDSRPGSNKGRAPASTAAPPLSLPLSRFNSEKGSAVEPASNNAAAGGGANSVRGNVGGGHQRRESETGSVTMIWSDGPVEQRGSPSSAGTARRSSSIRRWREGSRPGRDYSSYVAPTVRRGSAV